MAGLEKAESEKETSKTKLREVVGKFKAIQAVSCVHQSARTLLHFRPFSSVVIWFSGSFDLLNG